MTGELPGHPYTDLYPSVWGLGWFSENLGRVIPTWTDAIAAPDGMPFYFSSPLHGWLFGPLVSVIGLPASYTLGLLAARVVTVLCAYGAGTALGLRTGGALVLAAVYGCAPFFHGYAVEGILEGTNGWPLALWVWMAARKRWLAASIAGAFSVTASWYLGAAGCLLALGIAPFHWRAGISYAVGVLGAAPLIFLFFTSFPDNAPIDASVRALMGTTVWPFPRPGAAEGLQYAAKTSWLGWLVIPLAALSVRKHPAVAVGALAAWILSLGIGPWYELPVWRSLRFPYRLHAATLLCAGFLAGQTVDDLLVKMQSTRIRRWLTTVPAGAIVIEGLLLAPTEPIVPTAPAEVPAAYRQLRGQFVLSIPGLFARPPGEPNRSRQRARYVLYYSAVAGFRVPWAPDFNSVGTASRELEALGAVRSWDRLENDGPPQPIDVLALREAGIDTIVLHVRDLGPSKATALREHLVAQGMRAEERENLILLTW